MKNFLFYLITIVVPLLTCTFVIFAVSLLLKRILYQYYYHKRALEKIKIDIFLTSLVFSPFDEKEFAAQIRAFKKQIPFKKRWCKDVILNEIINLKENIKGDTTAKIHFIFEKFELFNHVLHYIKKNPWYKKGMAIKYFQALEYAKAEQYIRPLLKHKNKTLSSNAYIGLISLLPNKLEFLQDYANTISLTSEIRVMDILHFRKPKKPLNLEFWIDSENPSIVKLGIHFMVYFNDTSHSSKIMRLLESKDESVRQQVIIAARELFIEDAELILLHQFPKETETNKSEIIRTLSSIGTAISEDFILDYLNKSDHNDLRLNSVLSVLKINPHFFQDHIFDDPEVIKMVQHAKSEYI